MDADIAFSCNGTAELLGLRLIEPSAAEAWLWLSETRCDHGWSVLNSLLRRA